MKNTINLKANNCIALSNDELVEIMGGSWSWAEFKEGFIKGCKDAADFIKDLFK